MRDNVYVFMCEGSARRHRDVFCKLVAFSAVALVVLSLMTINPLYFGDGRASAAPGTPKLSTTYITLSSTATGTSLAPVPGTGFNLSDAANTAAFDVTTDNFTGYSIKITAADNDRTLVNTTNSSQVIDSIAEPTAQSDFVATDQTLINHWGIKPNKYYDNGSTITNTETIFPAPNETGLELDVTSTANASVANTYSVAVGAMLDNSVPSGTYTRETTIVVIPNPVYYVLSYHKNTGDNVTNLPEPDSGSTTSNKIIISNTAPERASYAFSGWCLGTTTTTNGVDSCDGTVFQPGDEFGIDQTVENTSTLYAMWQVNAFSCAAEYRLQNADGTYPSSYTSVGVINSAVPYGQACSYTSTQDSTLYTNQSASETVTGPTTLQLDIPRTTFTLTTNKNDTWVTGVTGAGTHRWGEAVAVVATLRNSAVFNGWSQTAGASSTFADNISANTTFTMPVGNATIYANAEAVGPAIQNLARSACPRTPTTVYDVRDDEVYTVQRLEDGRCWMTQNLRLGKTTDTLALTSADSDVANYTLNGKVAVDAFGDGDDDDINNNTQYTCNDYGCYYNWYTATAGTIPDTAKNATTSICPVGWTLPDGSDNNEELLILAEAYNNSVTDLLVNPTTATENVNGASAPGFTLSGYIWTDGGRTFNEKTFFWSKTATKLGRGANFAMTPPSRIVMSSSSSSAGMPVRCVLKENVEMQNISKDYLDVVIPNNGDRITLTDTRDNNKYQVTNINGEIWMTQNLRFTGTTLTPETSNVVTNRTLNDYSLDSNDASYAGHCESNSNSYNNTCLKDSGDTATGVWYNFAFATAGTIIGGSNKLNDAVEDICPAGWRLPTGPNTTNGTDINKLFNNTVSGYQTTPDLIAAFNADGRGYYYNGSRESVSMSRWLGSINMGNYNATPNVIEYYNSQLNGSASNNGSAGYFIRCILDHTSINDITTMQEFGTRSEAIKNSMTTNTVYTLTDTRDGESYKIAKLADGNVWMLENLNLAGGTALSADDTDVTSTYISGFTTQRRLTKDGNTIILPASAASGFNNSSNAFVYNSGNKTNCGASGQNTPCYSYYSWIAATLGGKQDNGSTAQNDNGYNAAASICPKGWKLPTSTTSNAAAQYNGNWKTGDWYTLATAYGANLENNYYQNSSTFYNNAGPGTTPNFLLAGLYDSGSFLYGGGYGHYWSATSNSSASAYYLYFGSEHVYSANGLNRSNGISVRCLAR